MSSRESNGYVRTSLRWDDIQLGSQLSQEDNLDLARWSRIDLRLEPEFIHRALTVYEQTLLVITFERADSLGRKLSR